MVGRMWLALKDLYTDIKARVLFSCSLSQEFNISQCTGWDRLLAPFMYKVYINGLLKTLLEHCFAISINSLSLPSPSFADDVTLLALFPSFLQTLINLSHDYSLWWRYQFNHIKSSVVTFGECKPIHSKLTKERKWLLGHTAVNELCEYKNLGVLKTYANFFLPIFFNGQFFLNFTVLKSLKVGLILPLFKGKGAKANNKDNY